MHELISSSGPQEPVTQSVTETAKIPNTEVEDVFLCMETTSNIFSFQEGTNIIPEVVVTASIVKYTLEVVVTSTIDNSVPIYTYVVKVFVVAVVQTDHKEMDEDIDTNNLSLSIFLKVKPYISSAFDVLD